MEHLYKLDAAEPSHRFVSGHLYNLEVLFESLQNPGLIESVWIDVLEIHIAFDGHSLQYFDGL